MLTLKSTTGLLLAAAAVLHLQSHDARAQLPVNPDSRIVRPSNTGIPGYVGMDVVAFDAQGRLWTAAHDFFWQQGGVAALDFDTGLWKTYSSEETPLDQESNSIAFAADGSAWIGGTGRIVRLHSDGESFTAYTPASTGVLVAGVYESISVAPNGHIWATNPGQVDLGGGLFEFDGTHWIKHEESWMTTWTGSGFAPGLGVIARSNGDVWASFLSSPKRMGLYRSGEWTVFEGEPYIIDYAEATDGTLYGCGAFGTYRLNDATGEWMPIGPHGASEIAVDPNDESLYIQSDLVTVMRFDGATWSTFATFPGWIGGIGVAPNSDVWIAAETWPTHWDLHHYNAGGQVLRVYNRSNTGMPSYFPPWIYRDRDDVMWFIDSEYGATRMEPDGNWRSFGVYNGEEEVYPAWVFPVGLPWWQTPGADFWTEAPDQVYHDTQGNFWLRGPNFVARSVADDLSQWTFWQPGQNGLPWLIDSLGEDAQGNIWVGNEYALYRLDGSQWIDTPIGIPQFAPIRLERGDDGELYAVRVATVYHVAGDTITQLYSTPDAFGHIHDMEVDAAGNHWIGTPEGLLYWDGATMTVYTPSNSAMSDLAVEDIAIRPGDGLVAVATSQQLFPPYTGGVALFDPAADQWVAYNHGSSFLPHYAVGDMQFDSDGHLWVGVLNYGTVQVFVGEEDVEPTPGDLNGDGTVNVSDLLMLLGAWGTCDGCPADLNGDGFVNVADMLALLAEWG